MKTSLLFEAAQHRAAQLRAERFAGCVILFYAPDGDGVSLRSFRLQYIMSASERQYTVCTKARPLLTATCRNGFSGEYTCVPRALMLRFLPQL